MNEFEKCIMELLESATLGLKDAIKREDKISIEFAINSLENCITYFRNTRLK